MTTITQARAESRLFPTLATTAWISTVLLILMGAIVRVTGHGLGCPDWPLCYGQAIPPAYTGAWVEFSHRLIGGIASAQIFAVSYLAYRDYRYERPIVRPALLAAGLLVIQIALGGAHVILEIPPQTGLVHTGIAMVIVGLLALIVSRSAPRMLALGESARATLPSGRALALITLATLAVYALLITGSTVTRTGASLACLTFPGCGALETTTRDLVDIHLLHRYTAYTVAVLTIAVIAWMLRRTQDQGLRRYAVILGMLLLLQFSLGIGNVLLRLPMWTRALHITVGATFWSAMVMLWGITRREQPA